MTEKNTGVNCDWLLNYFLRLFEAVYTAGWRDTQGSFRSTFVPKNVWPQTSRSHMTRLQRSRSPFAVHVWTLGKAASDSWTPSMLFFFLFESSRVCPIIICEVKSFFITNPFGMLRNQSFSLIFCLKWRTSIFWGIQDGGEHVDFFQLKADVDPESWKSRHL